MGIPSCTCDSCKAMCSRPCYATPRDAERLIRAGFADRLRMENSYDYETYVISPAFKGREGIDDRASDWANRQGCTFQDKDGLCELHDLGLKPLEARLVIHNEHPLSKKTPLSLHDRIVDLWKTNRGRRTIELLQQKRKEPNHVLD